MSHRRISGRMSWTMTRIDSRGARRGLGAALALGLGALAIAGCSPMAQGAKAKAQTAASEARSAPDDTPRHPVSGLPLIEVTVESRSGPHRFTVELAQSREEQARGLMFRERLGEDEGMLFPSNPPAPRSFWMKNTPIALDILFIGLDGRIVNIAENTTPYSLEPIVSLGPTSAVLEIRGGRARALGIAVGDRVVYRLD